MSMCTAKWTNVISVITWSRYGLRLLILRFYRRNDWLRGRYCCLLSIWNARDCAGMISCFHVWRGPHFRIPFKHMQAMCNEHPELLEISLFVQYQCSLAVSVTKDNGEMHGKFVNKSGVIKGLCIYRTGMISTIHNVWQKGGTYALYGIINCRFCALFIQFSETVAGSIAMFLLMHATHSSMQWCD